MSKIFRSVLLLGSVACLFALDAKIVNAQQLHCWHSKDGHERPHSWEAKSINTNLYPWQGEQVVVLATNNELNPVVMKRFVQRLEAGWETYKELIGRSPNQFKHLDGKAKCYPR